MGNAIDLSSEAICQSLAETKAWCGKQSITASVEETHDVKRRRILGERAAQLTRRALMRRNALWNRIFRRDYTDTRLWREGMELFRLADLGSIAPLEGQLRTLSLQPKTLLGDARNSTDREEIVHSVVMRRAESLRGQAYDVNGSGGKILLYAPEENLADGAAKYSSLGFFDVDNLPPWDTWLTFSDGILLSWVPELLIGLAQSGIDANSEGCIRWLD